MLGGGGGGGGGGGEGLLVYIYTTEGHTQLPGLGPPILSIQLDPCAKKGRS